MATITYKVEKEIPVEYEADVIIVGGGPGGLGAAVMAARNGVKTLLIERFSQLGGMASLGEVHPFMPNHIDGVTLDKPVYKQWVEAMSKYTPNRNSCKNSHVKGNYDRFISKEAAVMGAEDLCLEAGVEILYHHALYDVITKDGSIDYIVLFSKSGLTAAKAKIYVDCTGDGDLASRAGCEFEQGGPSGHCQPMTLCFKLGGIDRSKKFDRKGISEKYNKAKAEGRIDCVRENVLLNEWFDESIIHFNTTRVIHMDGTKGSDLSKAEIEARRQIRQIVEFLRADIPAFKDCYIHSIAKHIGIRETRRILGKAYLEKDAFIEQKKFPDSIAKVNYYIDIHNPDGSGTEAVHLKPGEWYEIPYGCIVAKDMNNLLVGGRPISVDHAIHSSMRIMPPACTVGSAAGMAAAMAINKNTTPDKLDGVEVHNNLKEQSANL
jgi:hypothetical protein